MVTDSGLWIKDEIDNKKFIIKSKYIKGNFLAETIINEFNNGVHMYGYLENNKLISIIGIQEVKDVALIRHAYTLTSYQKKGFGSILLKYLLNKNKNIRLLVGTWRSAIWAIKFYEKFGFVLHSEEKKTFLLKEYWQISSEQIINSVVLERY